MQVFHPVKPHEIAERNALLQKSLRPEALPFGIEREYPLVLDPAQNEYSYCLSDKDQLVAHANLWPRRFLDAQTGKYIKVGLIGNVATDEKWRGLGIMSTLFSHLKSA